MSEFNIIRYKMHKGRYLNPTLIYKMGPLKAYRLSHTKMANEIIASIPEGLDDKRKAYHVYLELGKRVSEDPKFVFADPNNQRELEDIYEGDLTEEGYGICKSIAETYHAILRDKRVGVKSVLVKSSMNKKFPHIDCLLFLDGKEYVTNLIADLSRIKTGKRTRNFGYRLEKTEEDPDFIQDPIAKRYAIERNLYATRMHRLFPNLSYFSEREVGEFDLDLGYSLKIKQNDGSLTGVYTNDVFDNIYETVGYGRDDSEYEFPDNTSGDERLRKKCETILGIADTCSHKNGNLNYLENIRFIDRTMRKMLTGEELARVVPYALATKGDPRSITSVVKVTNDPNDSESRTFYFVKGPSDDEYSFYSKEDLKDYMKSASGMYILGIMDRKRRDITSEDIMREN